MKAYKYRIYPNTAQQEMLAKHFGCVRHVYNWALSEKQKHYKETSKSLSKTQLQSAIVRAKKEDKPWLKEVNSQSLLASLLHLETAFMNFFKKRAKFPKFKSKYNGTQSFQCPQHVTIADGYINLPKIPRIKIKQHRSFEGDIKTVTIKRTPTGKHYASVLVDDGYITGESLPVVANETIGVDVGITHLFNYSDGTKVDNPKFLRHTLSRLKSEQRKLSRKKKGSANRAKQKTVVARIHEKVAAQRLDFLHKETARLADKSHATSIAIEDLNIKGMIKNRKLARAINDCAWGIFLNLLAYKCERNGKNLLKIGRFMPSSKTCNSCKHKVDKLPLDIRHWNCNKCRASNDRDLNAARNIRDFALADALGTSVTVKSAPVAMPISVGAMAKGVRLPLHESVEAPSIIATAI
jgi:putative transposase